VPIKPFGIPPQEAIKLIKAKGLNLLKSEQWQSVWAETHAGAFTVARSAGYDVLGDIYNAVLAAQEGKLTFKEFQAQLEPTLQAKGWWGRRQDGVMLGSPRRLEITYNTNLRQAEAAGKWARIQALKETRPYLRYVCTIDGKTREEHKAWHGLILPVDHPFWDTHMPPNDWGCRCDVMPLSREQMRRWGWKESEGQIPFDKTEPWLNEVTGREMMIPQGVHPAFAHNPGKVAMEVHAAQALGRTLEKLPPEVAAKVTAASGEFVARALTPQLKAMLDEVSRGYTWNQNVVVGGLRPEVLEWLKKSNLTPTSGAIGLFDKKLGRTFRDEKREANIALSRADILNMPYGLARPKKVLWDWQKKNLLYVYDSATTDEPRVVKVVVALDYNQDWKPDRSTKPKRITMTSIESGGLVDESSLGIQDENNPNAQYEQIYPPKQK